MAKALVPEHGVVLSYTLKHLLKLKMQRRDVTARSLASHVLRGRRAVPLPHGLGSVVGQTRRDAQGGLVTKLHMGWVSVAVPVHLLFAAVLR